MKNYKKLVAHDCNGDLSKRWFISYYYLNPKTAAFERHRETGDINRIHNVKDRREALYALLHAKKLLLEKGYSPYQDYSKDFMLESVGLLAPTLGECIERVLKHKQLHIAPLSYQSLKNRIEKFKTYLQNMKLLALEPNMLTKRQIMEYLDYRTTTHNISGRTRNNDLIDIKSLFSTMQDLELIKENPAARIKKVVTQSNRNEVYTDEQQEEVFKWMEENNPYLLLFCKFIYYGMLRPIEITRLQIADIDLVNNKITIPAGKTKDRSTQTVPIMEVLKEVILSMNLDQYPKEYYVFSAKKHPWIEPSTRDYFTDKFKAVKDGIAKKEGSKIVLTKNHTMYALKHTVISKLRSNGASADAVRKYSRHKSEQGFNAYTRYYDMQAPDDLSAFLVKKEKVES